MNDRWNYLIVEIKPGLMGGFKAEAMQEVLARHGQLGWELVNVVMQGPLAPAMAFFKKAV